MVSHGGRAAAPQTAERWRPLARSLRKKCAPPERVAQDPQWRVLETGPCGALSVLAAMWQRLGIPDVRAEPLASRPVDVAVERARCAMVAHRACAPSAQRACADQWWREEGRLDGTEARVWPHLYRAMAWREAHQDAREHAGYGRLADVLHRAVALLCSATTAGPLAIDARDQGQGAAERGDGRLAAGATTAKAPRTRGRSQNGRAAAPQVVIGRAVTREGLPVRHGVFPGTTVAVTTVAPGNDALRGGHLRRGVLVGDAGMVSQDNLHTRRASGGQDLLGRPRRRGAEVTTAGRQRPGRAQPVSATLRGKAVVGGAGDRRRRDVVCHTPAEAKRPRAPRRQVLRALAAARAARPEVRGARHSTRVCQRRARRRYGREVRVTTGGRRRMDAAKRRSAAPRDGQCVVPSHDDRLTPADVAWGAKPLHRVEAAWRTRTRGRRRRPVDPGAVHRLHAQVALRGWAW